MKKPVRKNSKLQGQLMKDMQSTDWELRMQAVETSSELPASMQRRVLALGCGDPSEVVRISAIEAIERLADRKFRVALLAALSDRSVLVRTYAVIGLVPICTRDDAALLERHLPGSRSTFRVALLWALFALGQPARMSALLKVLAATSDYHDVCMGASLISDLKLTNEVTDLVVDTLQTVRRRFNAVAVDEAVTDALARIQTVSKGGKRGQ